MPARGLPGGSGAHWPATVNDAVEAYGYGQAVAPRGASPQEILTMDRSLGWFWWLPERKRDAVIVSGFAMGISGRRIAKEVRGLSHQQCWRRDRFCLGLIAERLNRRWTEVHEMTVELDDD